MKTSIGLTALALVSTLAACGPKAENTASAVEDRVDNAAADVGNAAANAVDATSAAITTTPTGQGFADAAGKSDAFEIAAAKLAVTNASSSAVKTFAREMITAHTESTAKIKAAGREASPPITPDPTPTADQDRMIADLGKLKGAEFDKAYADGQVDAHETALALMKDYARDGDTPSLKAAAGAIAPKVEHHLEMAKALK